MSTETDAIEQIANQEYKWGFVTDIEADAAPKGLSEGIIRFVGPAHQYLSKPCNPDELRNAIIRALALRDVLGNERLKQLATRIENLPTLPALQNRLPQELQKESPSLECVGEIISHDIALTAKILQLVNSAFFCRDQPINNPAATAEAFVLVAALQAANIPYILG